MQKTRATLGGGFVLGLCVLLGVISSAEAVITIEDAEERNGVASIKGRGAVPGAQIRWEGAAVTAANNNNGAFSFLGVLPADCRGELSDGAETVLVDVLHCTPVSVDVPGPVAVTGQTTCYGASGVVIPCPGTAQDGDIQAGVPFPSPRFTDNGDGTVTDNLTNLIWLKNANCFPGVFGVGLQWEDQTGVQHALPAANTLASGSCGLTDGSVAGDWRLPNVKELQSLIDFGTVNPALPTGHPFLNVPVLNTFGVQAVAWSSTTLTDNELSDGSILAWGVSLTLGGTSAGNKLSHRLVWPVRGGE